MYDKGAEYEIRESARAKRLSVAVHPDGSVTVTKPVRVSEKNVHAFVEKYKDWIETSQAKFLRRAQRQKKTGLTPLLLPRPRKNSKAYTEARKLARALVTERLQHFNQVYGFRYGTISIRDQKTRWGSCSAAGNLSFNYRIVFLPQALQDYVVVHELAHVKEHNHSEGFWAQVARALPNHLVLKKELSRYAANVER